MAGMPMMDCAMMGAMHSPSAALQAGAALKLEPAQRTRLDSIQRRLQAAAMPAMESMRAIHTQLATIAKQPQLDSSAARAALEQMNAVHTTMGMAMLQASHDVNDVLTPAQRDSLSAITQREMASGGMAGCSGMMGAPMGPQGRPINPQIAPH